jgi:hypothetical protein
VNLLSSIEIAELAADEEALLPERRDAFHRAVVEHAERLVRDSERKRTNAQRELTDSENTIKHLREEHGRALAKEQAERDVEAKQARCETRSRLVGAIGRLQDQAAAISTLYGSIVEGWRALQTTIDEARQLFTSAELAANGAALSRSLSVWGLHGLLEAEMYRLGAVPVYRHGQNFHDLAPGARPDAVGIDHRQNPGALKPLVRELAQLQRIAIDRFDGVQPPAAQPGNPRDPKEFGRVDGWIRKAIDPHGTAHRAEDERNRAFVKAATPWWELPKEPACERSEALSPPPPQEPLPAPAEPPVVTPIAAMPAGWQQALAAIPRLTPSTPEKEPSNADG